MQLHHFFAGLDEVGRGPLAGPLVSCCTILAPLDGTLSESADKISSWLKYLKSLGVKDSKKLSALKRELIVSSLLNRPDLPDFFIQVQEEFGLVWGYSIAKLTPHEVDTYNIHQATFISMHRALKAAGNLIESLRPLKEPNYLVLIDGVYQPFEEVPGSDFVALCKADDRFVWVGLASVLAKVYRDRIMLELNEKYPEYGFNSNYGYPTDKHRKALKQYGPCPEHRTSFRGVLN